MHTQGDSTNTHILILQGAADEGVLGSELKHLVRSVLLSARVRAHDTKTDIHTHAHTRTHTNRERHDTHTHTHTSSSSRTQQMRESSPVRSNTSTVVCSDPRGYAYTTHKHADT